MKLELGVLFHPLPLYDLVAGVGKERIHPLVLRGGGVH